MAILRILISSFLGCRVASPSVERCKLPGFGLIAQSPSNLCSIVRVIAKVTVALLVFSSILVALAWARSEYVLDEIRFVHFENANPAFRWALKCTWSKGVVIFAINQDKKNVAYDEDLPAGFSIRHHRAVPFTLHPKEPPIFVDLHMFVDFSKSDDDVWWHRDRSLELPCWLILVLTSVCPALTAIQALRRRHRVREGFCPMCGYDLRATPVQCPECGRRTGTSAAG
jgi:hypothetical protein